MAAVGLTEVVNRENVRVRERSDGLGFTLEARQRLGRRGQAGGRNLDRYVAVELLVTGAKDLAHSSRAQRRDDAVGTQQLVRLEGHGAHGIM